LNKSLVLVGFVLFVVGIVLGFYASQRNCLIAFITSGYMSFWTVIEIISGIIALVGIIIALMGLLKRTHE